MLSSILLLTRGKQFCSDSHYCHDKLPNSEAVALHLGNPESKRIVFLHMLLTWYKCVVADS